jgi:hypothetical protein
MMSDNFNIFNLALFCGKFFELFNTSKKIFKDFDIDNLFIFYTYSKNVKVTNHLDIYIGILL